MMAVEAMFDVSFLVEDVDNFVYLIGVSAGERDKLIILSHLVEKMLSVWSKHVTL